MHDDPHHTLRCERTYVREGVAALAFAVVPAMITTSIIVAMRSGPASAGGGLSLCGGTTAILGLVAIACFISRSGVVVTREELVMTKGIVPFQRTRRIPRADVEQWAVSLVPLRSGSTIGTGWCSLSVRIRGEGWIETSLRYRSLAEASAIETRIERLMRITNETLPDSDDRSELDREWRAIAVTASGSVTETHSVDATTVTLRPIMPTALGVGIAVCCGLALVGLVATGTIKGKVWIAIVVALLLVNGVHDALVPLRAVINRSTLRFTRLTFPFADTTEIPIEDCPPVRIDCRSASDVPVLSTEAKRRRRRRQHSLLLERDACPPLRVTGLGRNRARALAFVLALEEALAARAHVRPSSMQRRRRDLDSD